MITYNVFGNEVQLDFVIPTNKNDEMGGNCNISYNSVLGVKETVNIPMLWVDDEIYVLIDGVFKALEELLIKPKVTGNMDKIPYYVNVKYGLDDKAEIITTDAIYVDSDGERKYFNEVLKTPEGIYLPLDRFIEIYEFIF